jgi:hypothetical protein
MGSRNGRPCLDHAPFFQCLAVWGSLQYSCGVLDAATKAGSRPPGHRITGQGLVALILFASRLDTELHWCSRPAVPSGIGLRLLLFLFRSETHGLLPRPLVEHIRGPLDSRDNVDERDVLT